MKWKVWDQIQIGEVNVALWGQSDHPMACCNSDRREQWDITHPVNIARRVRGCTWLRFCLSACPTVGLSVYGWAHSHAWIHVAAFAEMWLDRLYPREKGSASSCDEDCSALISLQRTKRMPASEPTWLLECLSSWLAIWKSQAEKKYLSKEIFL